MTSTLAAPASSSAASRSQASTSPKPNPPPPTRSRTQTVEEITIDPTLGVHAPRTEVGKPEQRKSSVRLQIEKLVQNQVEEEIRGSTQTCPPSKATEDPHRLQRFKKNRQQFPLKGGNDERDKFISRI